ncbi:MULTISPECIES: MerR family transcriptional regulator [unclassified Dietzia]|uniref:MerR family transcriptional regulator n=1 Tax=unclassified Dietzia TaxID=2617939 RepID=UPI000D222E64|nr:MULTISPECIES: MerR family transcriptional regulator [unclassified Dietzia]AVZ40385.1 MerR family transcriptional regulator [Dietzia sp. JS16-p6b]QGW25880.1 MerR family transcriptional regulator [Dietzia sp. DQ12-45-1b]
MSSRRSAPLQRIDELAETSGATVRNIRVYQERGLLQPPIRKGRTALYGPDHRSRLEMILRLLNRGYTFATIEELLIAERHGFTLAELLEVESVRSERRPTGSRRRRTRSESQAVASFDIPETLKEVGESIGLVTEPGAAGHLLSDAYIAELLRDLIVLGVDADGIEKIGRLVMEGQGRAVEAITVLVEALGDAGIDKAVLEKRVRSTLPRAGTAARLIFLSAAETLLAERHGFSRD